MTKKFIIENVQTLVYALIIAIFIRSIFIQPFYIPSSSMEPNLLVGDRLFVTKYSYGYSKHSFPFSPPIFKGRLLFNEPKRGDIIVFKTPADNRTDYIKRLIGLPGDKIQFIDGDLFINNQQIFRTKINKVHGEKINCGKEECIFFEEKISNDITHITIYHNNNNLLKKIDESSFTEIFKFLKNNPWSIKGIGEIKFNVPKDHYFFMGDNRDNSSDSRVIGYVHKDNLVGKAQFLFFSSNREEGSIFKFWKWNKIIRFERFFKKIK